MANKERVQLLVDALRSGEHVQGRGRLERIVNGNAERCCLGVACRVAIANGVEVQATFKATTYLDGYTSFDGEAGHLPITVSNWFGFGRADPILYESYLTAIGLNDGDRKTFLEIADAFEATYITETVDAIPGG